MQKKALRNLIYILSFVFPLTLSAQQINTTLLQDSEHFCVLAETMAKDMRYDSACIYYKQALDSLSISTTSRHHLSSIKIAYAKALTGNNQAQQALDSLQLLLRQLPRKDSLIGDVYYTLGLANNANNEFWTALYNFRKSLEYYKTHKKQEKLAQAYNKIGTIHQQLGDFQKAMSNYDKAAMVIRNDFSDTHAFFSTIYNNIGIVYAKLASYKEALSYFKKTLEIDLRSQERENLSIAGSYHNIGAVYYLENDHERALEFLEHALQINKENLGEQHINIAQLYNDIGLVYRSKQQYDEALMYFQRALHIYRKKLSKPTQNSAEVDHNIALLYLEKGDLSDALKKVQETLKIYQDILPKEHFIFGQLYRDIGQIYFKQKDYRKAITFYQQAKPILTTYFGNNHPEVANNYTQLGEAYNALPDTRTAIKNYQKAIQSAVPNFVYQNIYENPNIQESGLILKYHLLNALHQKAKALHQLYRQENRKDHLLQAYNTHQLVIELLNLVRTEYDSEGARENLVNNTTGFYESAVRINLELYEQSQNDKYLKNAFNIIEKSKSTLLLEGTRDSEAKRFGGVPKKLLQRQEELQMQLDFHKTQIERLKNQGELMDSLRIAILQQEIFNIRTEQDSLLAMLKDDHPKYYDYKYESPNISLQKVQRYLDKKDILIEYMWGKNTLYTIAISKDEIKYFQQKIDDDLIERITNYHNAFQLYQSNPQISDEEYDERLAAFTQDAYYLYKRLLDPILSSKKHIENLIIIPDSYLGYISFETLIRDAVETKASYRSLPYLLRDYNIRYDYSTTLLLLADKEKEIGQWIYMGVAPSYPKTGHRAAYRDIVEPLKHNQPEVRDILWEVGGHSTLGQTATEANFKRNAENYRILHLAMHAFADDNNPKLSRLAFAASQDTLEDGYLHIYELYNMRLKAELAVLSACDTGNGQIHPGEGVISLARAFKFAGCSNIVMSLWKANDETTKDIMVDFYRNLREGMNKSKALRKAKIDYLNNPETQTGLHPSYWATFVLIGSDAPVEIDVPFRMRYFVYLAGFIIFFGFFFLWERKVIDMVLDTK